MITRLLVAAALLCLAVSPSDARQNFIYQHGVGAGYYVPEYTQRKKGKKRIGGQPARKNALTAAVRNASVAGDRRVPKGTAQLLPHPPGCPSRAFCGCGAALEVFGKHVRNLWLARNWFQFPRAQPAPGMVAVRRHHVFVIREVRGPGMVLAYDANSRGRKTWLHLRSLRGYAVVNPRGSRYANAG